MVGAKIWSIIRSTKIRFAISILILTTGIQPALADAVDREKHRPALEAAQRLRKEYKAKCDKKSNDKKKIEQCKKLFDALHEADTTYAEKSELQGRIQDCGGKHPEDIPVDIRADSKTYALYCSDNW